MKYLISTLLLISSLNSVACWDNDPYEQCDPPRAQKTNLKPSFKESVFDFKSEQEANDKSYCYQDKAQGVCEEMKKHVYKVNFDPDMNETIRYFKCDDSDEIVTASYTLFSDHIGLSEYEVRRVISKCE